MSEPRVAACVWTQDTDLGDVYDGSCGIKWEFTDGGPRENNVIFCPHCGARVSEDAKKVKP